MAASAGPTPGRSSPTTGSGARPVSPSSRGSPAARRWREERMASAPAIRVADREPAAMSAAARLTSHWGEFPPMVVTSHTAGASPSRRANSVAGAGPVLVITSTTERRPMRSRSPPRPSRAASPARAMRSTGVTGARRSIDWPKPTTTGRRSGSVRDAMVGRQPTTGGGGRPAPWQRDPTADRRCLDRRYLTRPRVARAQPRRYVIVLRSGPADTEVGHPGPGSVPARCGSCDGERGRSWVGGCGRDRWVRAVTPCGGSSPPWRQWP